MDKERLKKVYEKLMGLRKKIEEEYEHKTAFPFDHVVRNCYFQICLLYDLVMNKGMEFSENDQKIVRKCAREVSRYFILLRKFPEFRKAEMDPERTDRYFLEFRAVNPGDNYVDYAWSKLMGDKGKQ